MSKIRTQIQMEADDYQVLSDEARRRGLSISHLVREAIRRTYGSDRRDQDAAKRFLSAAGIGREPDARRDVARRHDDFLSGGGA